MASGYRPGATAAGHQRHAFYCGTQPSGGFTTCFAERLDSVGDAVEARTMKIAQLLNDAFDRVAESAAEAVDDLRVQQLVYRPRETGNSIAWLIWHLTRVQDDHVSELAQREQSWIADGWMERFDLDLPPADTGFGHRFGEVDKVSAPAHLLTGYLSDVTTRTKDYLSTLSDTDYDLVIDASWEPAVTLGVRLVSVVNDTTQHAGQAAYVRGLIEAG